jgi:hypothetical protein
MEELDKVGSLAEQELAKMQGTTAGTFNKMQSTMGTVA